MPKTVGELINDLAIKAGIKPDDDHLKNILSAPDLQKITIPDELVVGIDNGLLSVEAARNNHPDIKKHYMAQAFNGLDSELEATMDELELDDDVRKEIRQERSSTKRAAALARKVKELESKKQNVDNKGDKVAIQKQIDDLHAQLRAEKENGNAIRAEYEGKIKGIHVQSKLESIMNGYKTVYDELPGDVKTSALNSLINKALQDNDAEFSVDDKGAFVLVKKDGTNVFGDNHVQLTPQTFIDKTLSQNKLLKVTEAPKPNNTQNGSQTIDGNKNTNHTLKGLAAQSLQDLGVTP